MRVSNCTAWYKTPALTDGKPIVVHPATVKELVLMVAGSSKSQHYICGTEANELDAGGFRLSPLARSEFTTFPEGALGHAWASVTATWRTTGDLFERGRAVLRDGTGVRSGMSQVDWDLSEIRFWNQVTDTMPGDWTHTTETRVERRFDAQSNHQQLSRDVHRQEIACRSKKDFQRLQRVAGLFGLVRVSAMTEQGGDAISRFKTGTNLRACTSDEAFADASH